MAPQVRDPARFTQKVFRAETRVLDAASARVQATMSTEAEDREGDVIRASGWDLRNFLAHPVLLSSHDYGSLRSQIGEWEDVRVVGTQLIGVARYYIGEGNPEADWGYTLAAKGRAAYSVGFIPLEWQARESERDNFWGSYEFLRQELLETSQVTVPANAQALQMLLGAKGLHPALRDIASEVLADHAVRTTKQELECECMVPDCEQEAALELPLCKEHVIDLMQAPMLPMRGLDQFSAALACVAKAGRIMSQANLDKLHKIMSDMADIHAGVCDMGDACPMGGDGKALKGAIPPKSAPKADEDAAWDAGAEVKAADGAAELRRMHAWVDGEGDPEAKGSYKLPHHLHTGEVVWRGVAAAGAAVQGGRGGMDIPEGDVSGVKAHLALHYRQFDKTPPWEGDGGKGHTVTNDERSDKRASTAGALLATARVDLATITRQAMECVCREGAT